MSSRIALVLGCLLFLATGCDSPTDTPQAGETSTVGVYEKDDLSLMLVRAESLGADWSEVPLSEVETDGNSWCPSDKPTPAESLASVQYVGARGERAVAAPRLYETVESIALQDQLGYVESIIAACREKGFSVTSEGWPKGTIHMSLETTPGSGYSELHVFLVTRNDLLLKLAFGQSDPDLSSYQWYYGVFGVVYASFLKGIAEYEDREQATQEYWSATRGE